MVDSLGGRYLAVRDGARSMVANETPAAESDNDTPTIDEIPDETTNGDETRKRMSTSARVLTQDQMVRDKLSLRTAPGP